jgi:outer membrane protein insertion porin family
MRLPSRAVVLALAIMAGTNLGSWQVCPASGKTELRNAVDPCGGIVSEIRLHGLERTREYVVTRELATKVGKPCSRKTLDEDVQRLENLDIFASIQVEPILESRRTVVVYQFVESLFLLPSISIQLSEENGLSAGGGLKAPNFLGRDIYLSGRALFGGATTVEARVHQPWAFAQRWGYLLEYALRNRENKIADFDENANELDLWIQGNWGNRGRVGGHLQFQRIHSDKDGVTLDPDNVDHVSRIGLVLGWDSRDAYVDTRRGWRNEIVFSQAVSAFANAGSYSQVDLDLRRYQPIPFWDRHSLAVYSLTTVRTGAVGVDVAPWQRFGVGGTNTVRGWEYAARKGKNQFIGTVAYRVTVMEPRGIALPFGINYRLGIQLAAFADAGIAWSESREFAMRDFIGGTGAGIRFLVPIIGELRCDVGLGGGGVRLHLGAPEKPEMARRRVR